MDHSRGGGGGAATTDHLCSVLAGGGSFVDTSTVHTQPHGHPVP